MEELILVTGATGKIGSRVVRQLLASGHKVRALVHRRQLAGLEDPNLETAPGSLEDPDRLQAVCEGVIRVCHLGAAFDLFPPAVYEKDNALLFRVNVEGTFHLVEFARQLPGLKQFLFASTDAVYNTGARKFEAPVTEDIERESQRFYALTKMLGEDLLLHYARSYDFPYTIVRFTWTLAEDDILKVFEFETWEDAVRESDRERLRALCASGKKLFIPLMEDGYSAVEHIADADDVAAGVVLMLTKEAALGETFHLAAAEPFKYLEVIEEVARLAGKSWESGICEGLEPYEFDLSKARRLLGYEPRLTVLDTVRRAVEAAGG